MTDRNAIKQCAMGSEQTDWNEGRHTHARYAADRPARLCRLTSRFRLAKKAGLRMK
jgi:hypothetical protein